jgi:hypothetical protein
VIDSALTLTHSNFEGFLGDGTLRKDANPDVTTTFDVAGHGDTGGLDLAAADAPGARGLECEIAKGDMGTAGSTAAQRQTVHFAELNSIWKQHG